MLEGVLTGIKWTDMLIVLFIGLATRWIFKNLMEPYFSPLRKFPGKPYRPIVGNMFEATRSEAMSNAIRWIREIKALTIRYYHFGGEERLLTADPAVFRHVLVTNVKNYHRVIPNGSIINLMKRALFFLSGDAHHVVRKLLNPAFGVNILEGMFPVFEAKAKKVAEIWKQEIEKSDGEKQFPVQDYMTRITLDCICDIGFDYHPDSITQPDSAGVRKLSRYLQLIGGPSLISSLVPFYSYLPTQRNNTRRSEEDYISKVIKTTILEKKEEYKNRTIDDGLAPRDLLSLLLLAKDEHGNSMPEHLIFENVTGLMFAGFDTTSITLTWVMLQLATYPEVQSKARKEVLKVLPDQSTSLTHDLLDKLQYLGNVIRETQRLYPVVSSVTRRAVQDDVINGKRIPAGTKIVLHIGALHRSEENWEDPESFKPERFKQKIEPYKHLPFITGQYMCIGQKFAQFEMKIILACLLREFEFTLVPGYKFRRIQALSVKPHPPLVLNVRKI